MIINKSDAYALGDQHKFHLITKNLEVKRILYGSIYIHANWWITLSEPQQVLIKWWKLNLQESKLSTYTGYICS